jgi:hypothetical protein
VQGDYKGAVNELVAAYCISPYYTILKDIGQAYERERDYDKAIAYLERFVMNVPKDAKRPDACSADPQDERKNVIARINVLGALKAKILINTDPADSKITLSNDAGIAEPAVEPSAAGEAAGAAMGTVRLADDLVTKARQTSARICFIEDPAPLEPYGGVAATASLASADSRCVRSFSAACCRSDWLDISDTFSPASCWFLTRRSP